MLTIEKKMVKQKKNEYKQKIYNIKLTNAEKTQTNIGKF